MLMSWFFFLLILQEKAEEDRIKRYQESVAARDGDVKKKKVSR